MELFIFLNPVGIFRTLIYIAVIYFVIRLFTRYILPLIVDKKLKDMQRKMHEQQNQSKRSGRNEGDVTIEYDRRRGKDNNSTKGEYIDFEEVD